MSYTPPLKAEETAFKTTATLAAGATFTSASIAVDGALQVQTEILASHDGTIAISFCSDAALTNVVRSLSIPYKASDGYQFFAAPAFANFIEYKFINGATSQTNFYYTTKLTTTGISPQLLTTGAFIAPSMVTELGRNIIVGQNDAGTFNNVATDNQNNINVNAANHRVIYDEFPVSELTAISQLTFPYNINADLTNTITVAGGTVTQDSNMAVISTGATASNTATESAALESAETVTYRAGEGALGRFSGLFTDYAPNGATSTQGIGLGDANNGYGFTLEGTSSELNITYRSNGTSTKITQSLWNEDTMDGSGNSGNPSGMLLDVTKGNVYQVSYGSGFGCVYFSIESQSTGHMVLVHTLHITNLRTTPSSYNPTFALRAEVFKDGTSDTNDYVVKVSDMSSFVQGKDKVTGPVNAFENEINGNGTDRSIFTLQNKATYQGKTNKVSAVLSSISLINDTNGAGTFRIWENATLGGSPSYTDINTNNSIISQDTAGTTITGGKLLWVGGAGKDNGSSVDLTALAIKMRPGSTYTFSCSTLGGSNPMAIGVVWAEDM
jgi:hypothetical protein